MTRSSERQVERWRREFFGRAGGSLDLLTEVVDRVSELAVAVKDAMGRILFANRAYVRAAGRKTASDVLGRAAAELFPLETARVADELEREVLETGRPVVDRLCRVVADGLPEAVYVSVRPVVAADGARIGTVFTSVRAENRHPCAAGFAPVRRALLYVDRHYPEQLSVGALAHASGYSTARFRLLFRQIVGMSPSDYVMSVRIAAAKRLLLTSAKRISDIAVETGFFDQSHFIRAFRKRTGTTPLRYRGRSEGGGS